MIPLMTTVNSRLASRVGRQMPSKAHELRVAQPEVPLAHDDLPSEIVEPDPS